MEEIKYTDGHDQLQAANNEVAEVDDGIYTERNVLQNENNDDVPGLEGENESRTTHESETLESNETSEDLLNQGVMEIDSNDLEPTREENFAEEDSNSAVPASDAPEANRTRDDSESSSEDDQIVVITGNEIARDGRDEEILQNENNDSSVRRRFDHLQFKASLKNFADRQPLKLVKIPKNKII